MASFISRVELHSATYKDYETLHAAMEKRGYSRTITSDDRVTYFLPTGTYDCSASTWTLSTAISVAKAAAAETGKSYEVIVAERSGATWYGLTKK